jgi:hypothetical protein
LTFTQGGDRPARQGRTFGFDTRPSKPIRPAWRNRSGPISPCSNAAVKMLQQLQLEGQALTHHGNCAVTAITVSHSRGAVQCTQFSDVAVNRASRALSAQWLHRRTLCARPVLSAGPDRDKCSHREIRNAGLPFGIKLPTYMLLKFGIEPAWRRTHGPLWRSGTHSAIVRRRLVIVAEHSRICTAY